MATFASRSGNFILNLLKGIVDPFRRGIGTGQQAVAGRAGVSPEQLRQRTTQVAGQGGLAGILGQLAQKTQLRPEEATELQQRPALTTAKTLAGQGAFFVPGGKGVKGLAKAGAVAGGLAGFGGAKRGEELTSALGGTALGGALGIGGGLLGKFSQKLGATRQAKKVTDTGITGKGLKPDPFFLKNREELRKVGTSLGFKKGQTPTTQLKLIQGSFDDTQQGIANLLQGADPIQEDQLLDDFIRNLDATEFEEAAPASRRFIKGLLDRLEDTGGDPTQINTLKSKLRSELGKAFKAVDKGNLPSKPDQAKMALWKGLKESLDGISPEIREANSFQKQLFDVADELGKRIKTDKPLKFKLPLGGDIPTGVTREGAGAVGGRIAGGLEGILGVPGRVAGAVAGGAERVAGQPQARAGILGQILQAGGQPQPTPQPVEPTEPTEVDETQLPIENQNALAIVRQAREQAGGGQAGQQISIDQLGQVLLDPSISKGTKDNIKSLFKVQQDQIKTQKKEDNKLITGSIVEQIELLPSGTERTGARVVKDVYDAILKAQEKVAGTPTGPLSNITSDVRAVIGEVTDTKQLELNLKEVFRVIRKESTGVAFSDREIEELLKELPSVGQQESIVKVKLDNLQGRLEQKLGNFGISTDPQEALQRSQVRQSNQSDILQLLQQSGLDLSNL